MTAEAAGTIGGVISPWAASSEERINPAPWSVFVDKYGVSHARYPTPFCVLADLLERWTMLSGSKLTAECDDRERFKRLVEVIGGYPLIGGGYRPLDFPAHPLSKPALVLSSYLDALPLEVESSSWQSVRSHALMYDLSLRRSGNQDYAVPLQKLTSFLLYKIDQHEKEHGEKQSEELFAAELQDSSEETAASHLTIEARRFLAVLHSHANDRMRFWPPQLRKKFSQCLDKKLWKGIRDYGYHEFKLEKIQTWIQHWWRCIPENQVPGIRQNFLIGPSVILEGMFARVRSYILDKFGMGSICIDGGGRIAFLSTASSVSIAAAMEEFVHCSFLQLGSGKMKHHPEGNMAHRHPYSSIITEAMNHYILQSKKRDTPTWQAYLSQLPTEKAEHEKKSVRPSQSAFRYFIGERVTERLLPQLSVSTEERHASMTKTCSHAVEYDTNASLRTPGCKLCEGDELVELGTENCTEVCAMHWIVHEIARASKIRNTSLGSQPGPSNGLWGEHYGKIADVVALDGNALGHLFLKPFSWVYEETPPNQNDPLARIPKKKKLAIWAKYAETNASIRQKKDSQETEDWDDLAREYDLDPESIRHRLSVSSDRLRLNALMRTMRRSFDFNTNWALAFQNIFYDEESGLSPWIYAGDDIVLVNRKGMNEHQLALTLNDFHRELNTLFPKCTISFAGGWALRPKGEHIHHTLERALANERVGKHTWKGQIAEDVDFASMLGHRTFCETCEAFGRDWLNKQSERGLFVYDEPQSKPHSLILRLDDIELERLSTIEPSSYEK